MEKDPTGLPVIAQERTGGDPQGCIQGLLSDERMFFLGEGWSLADVFSLFHCVSTQCTPP